MILQRLGCGVGRGFTIFAIEGIRDEIAKLDRSVRAPIIAMLEDVAANGMPPAPSQVRLLRDGIFELKPSGTRLLFYYDPANRQVVILTSMIKKQKFRMPGRHVEHANRIRKRIERAREEGTLTYAW